MFVTASSFLCGLPALAQTATWTSGFAPRGLARSAVAAVTFDDGGGAALFAGDAAGGAGDLPAGGAIAKWDGQGWSPFASTLGGVPTPFLQALAVFDPGTGPELYASGSFNVIEGISIPGGLAKWSGGSWSDSGHTGNFPYFLKTVDDGNGPALYVGSHGSSIPGLANTNLAKWDGSTWTTVGTPLYGIIEDVCSFDDGSGLKLYVAGHQLNWGTSESPTVARWDGSSWSTFATTSDYRATSFAVFDDGGGPALYVGGSFTNLSNTGIGRVAKWTGSGWAALGSGFGEFTHINEMEVFGSGANAKLIVGGRFTSAGGISAAHVASWDGATWSALGASGNGAYASSNPSVWELANFDVDAGPELFVGGVFFRVGDVAAANAARWNGSSWSAFGDGHGLVDSQQIVYSLEWYDGELYAGGRFTTAGESTATHLARWDGSRWAAAGGAAEDYVFTLATFDDGAGERLFAGGEFADIGGQAIPKFAAWNGASWSSPGGLWTEPVFTVFSQCVFDDGTGEALYVGGNFWNLFGLGTRNIFRWDGAAISQVGENSFNGNVYALGAYDDGQGAKLCAGGAFIHSQGQPVSRVARWDGAAWGALASGLSSPVYALLSFDDGSGTKLYAGGGFSFSSTNRGIARFNGTAWEPVGDGFNSDVHALAVFDDGAGPKLYAGGSFSQSGPNPARALARWDGASWSNVAGGVGYSTSGGASVRALLSVDDGQGLGPALYVGGNFTMAGNVVSYGIARYGRECTAQSYCTSGTTSSGCEPVIAGIGTASASLATSFTIEATQLEGAKSGHVFYGLNGPNAAAWGQSSHFLCVKAPSQRTGTQSTGGNAGLCDGVIALDWNAYVSSHPTSLGVPFSAGQSVWAQCYFRDPAGSKTTALTNGLLFTVCP